MATKTGPQKLGVVLVDPLPIVRRGLELIVEHEDSMDLLASAGTAGEAMEDVRQLTRHGNVIAVVSTGLDGEQDCTWLIRQLRESFPTVRIVASGANSDEETIAEALFVGADGFIDKNSSPDAFLAAMHTAATGEMVLVGPPSSYLGGISREMERKARPHPVLSEREREVLELGAKGMTAKKVADELGLAERTVTTHFCRIYSKLGVTSRVGAISAATRMGLIHAY